MVRFRKKEGKLMNRIITYIFFSLILLALGSCREAEIPMP